MFGRGKRLHTVGMGAPVIGLPPKRKRARVISVFQTSSSAVGLSVSES